MANTLEEKPHYNQIDALKGVAIFLVVLGHSIILYPINLHNNNICDYIFRWLSSVHMPLFFTISGFCFSYRGKYKPYIIKKVKRLIIPYIIFNFIDIVPRYLLPNLVNRPRGIGESVKQIIFHGGEYWFLYTLFIIFTIYPLIYGFIKNNVYKGIAALVIILTLHYALPPISIFKISTVIYYLFFFTIGVIIKSFIGTDIFQIKFNKLRASIIVVFSLLIWCFLIQLDVSHLNILTAVVGILTLFICMQYSSLICLFKRFGKYSLQLYLLNGFLLTISRTIIVSILGVTNPLGIITFNMLIDFGLSYIIIKYICDKIKVVKICMGML